MRMSVPPRRVGGQQAIGDVPADGALRDLQVVGAELYGSPAAGSCAGTWHGDAPREQVCRSETPRCGIVQLSRRCGTVPVLPGGSLTPVSTGITTWPRSGAVWHVTGTNREQSEFPQVSLAPAIGLEPITCRLTAGRSAD